MTANTWTHIGTVNASLPGRQSGHAVRTVRLAEKRLTWKDVDSGQLYSKVTGCVRPCNPWDSRVLDVESVKPRLPEG